MTRSFATDSLCRALGLACFTDSRLVARGLETEWNQALQLDPLMVAAGSVGVQASSPLITRKCLAVFLTEAAVGLQVQGSTAETQELGLILEWM